jgi:hypothetical protein
MARRRFSRSYGRSRRDGPNLLVPGLIVLGVAFLAGLIWLVFEAEKLKPDQAEVRTPIADIWPK